MANSTLEKVTSTPAEDVPSFTLRADDSRHLKVLIAGLRWAEQQFGARHAFTQEIAAAVRTFDIYEQTHRGTGSGARGPVEGPIWPKF
jgi:hypothetical protein